MEEQFRSLKKTARTAGLLYFIMAITGAYGMIYVPAQLFIEGEAALTSNNILVREFFFRSGIYSCLLCQTVFIFLVLKLYRLFKQVHQGLAITMVALVLVAVPIAFLVVFNQLFALIALKEGFMNAFEQAQKNSLSMVFLKMYEQGNLLIGIFWGLWLIPFGQLVYRSGFIPEILGTLLVIGGLSYIIDATTFILFPSWQQLTNILVGILSGIAELSMVLWLLIKGVRIPVKIA